MNVSNLANLFQQNSIFQQSRPLGQKLGQPLVNDTLHRLSENFLTAQVPAKTAPAPPWFAPTAWRHPPASSFGAAPPCRPARFRPQRDAQ